MLLDLANNKLYFAIAVIATITYPLLQALALMIVGRRVTP